MESANASLVGLQSTPPPKHKQTTPHVYDATRKADIGKYAAHHGPTGPDCPAGHFSKVCGHKIPESTARKFRDAYLVELKRQASIL